MNFIDVALKEANKAYKIDDVPVGCVIVKNDKILAKAHNKRNRNKDILSHAEILCIKKASKKLKSWNLYDCDMYVTLKPCSICENVIKQARINNVYYLIDKDSSKKEYFKTKFCKLEDNIQENYYKNLLSIFFKEKRVQK